MDQAQWTGVVNDMVSKGAQGTQQDFDNIIAYLTANYGKDTPPTAAPATTGPQTAARRLHRRRSHRQPP